MVKIITELVDVFTPGVAPRIRVVSLFDKGIKRVHVHVCDLARAERVVFRIHVEVPWE
jgi:hypothetical protein